MVFEIELGRAGPPAQAKFADLGEQCLHLSQLFHRIATLGEGQELPSEVLQREASYFAIADFMTLFDVEEEAPSKILKVQKALADQRPVVIGMNILKNFPASKGVKTWNPSIGNPAFAGGHAVVVVGYNEFRGAFQIMNSWGQEWGDNGFIWIKYKDFAEYVKYGYVLHLGEAGKDQRPIEVAQPSRAAQPTSVRQEARESAPAVRPTVTNRIAGQFEFKYLDTDNDDDPTLTSAAVRYNGSHYRVQRTDWEIGQFFQLVTTSTSDNDYIYVFSVDADQEVNIHWPRRSDLNPKFVGINESALVPSAGSTIYIPGKDSGLKLAKKGIEHLCILFSTKEISNIQAVSDYMADQKADFAGALRELLNDFLVPQNAIHFANDRIEFSTDSGDGFIIPIVVELEAR